MANSQTAKGVDRDVELGARIRLYRRKVAGLGSLEAFAERMLEAGYPLTVDQLGDIERGTRPCGAIELDWIAHAIAQPAQPFQPFIGVTMSLSAKVRTAAQKLAAATSAPENSAYDQEITALTKLLKAIGVSSQTIKTAYSVTPQLDFTVEGIACSLVSSDTAVRLMVNDRETELFGKTEGSSFPAFNQEHLEAAIVEAVGAIVATQKPTETSTPAPATSGEGVEAITA